MIKSAEEFVRLRSSDDPAEYHRAAHDSADISVWQDVIARFPEYIRWVVHNKSVPRSILKALAVDPDPDARYWVAMKNCVADELFSLLARDVAGSVRQRVAYNKNVPTDILEQLSKDPDELVAEAANERLAQKVRL